MTTDEMRQIHAEIVKRRIAWRLVDLEHRAAHRDLASVSGRALGQAA